MKIWELTELENDYNCTPYVVRRWNKKPSIELLAKAMDHVFPSNNDKHTLTIVKCWQGEEVRFTDYGNIWELSEVEVIEL